MKAGNDGVAARAADYVLGVDNLKGSTTFSIAFAWPVCAHEKRFQISSKVWIIRWTCWVCPDCKKIVAPEANP